MAHSKIHERTPKFLMSLVSGYWRSYIKGYSAIVEPLTTLIKKSKGFVWDREQQRAFDENKRAVCGNVVLSHLESTLPIELHCGASCYG